MDERQYKIIVIQKSEDESMAPKDSNEMAQNEVLTWNAGSANFSGQAAVAAVSKWQVEMISLLCGKLPALQTGWCLSGKMILWLPGPNLRPNVFKLLDRMSESCLEKTGTNGGGAGKWTQHNLKYFFPVWKEYNSWVVWG